MARPWVPGVVQPSSAWAVLSLLFFAIIGSLFLPSQKEKTFSRSFLGVNDQNINCLKTKESQLFAINHVGDAEYS